MTLYTEDSIRNATIILETADAPPGAQRTDYADRMGALMQCHPESFSRRAAGVKSEAKLESSDGTTLQYRFRNFVFGGVSKQAAYAQLFDHLISLKRENGKWAVARADFKIRTCDKAYPLPGRGIKIRYILEKTDGNAVIVMDAANPGASNPGTKPRHYISREYASGAPGTVLVARASVFDTGVDAAPGEITAAFKAAFKSIRWNLAAKIEWQRL